MVAAYGVVIPCLVSTFPTTHSDINLMDRYRR